MIRYTWKDYTPSNPVKTAVSYAGTSLSGPSIGAELGGDALNGDLFYSAGYTGAMLGGAIYSSSIDLQAGYAFLPNVFTTVGYNLFTRSLSITDQNTQLPLGDLSDSGWAVSLGVGYQY